MRRFLSFLLVVLLLFSLLAVPASAMSAGAVVTAVDGLAAVSSIIAGSGVTIAALENFDAWNTLVSSVSEYLTAKNIIDAASTIAALKSGSKIYFPSSVVLSVRDWLFDSLTIGADGSISSVTTARLEFGSYYWDLINMKTSARLLPVAWKNTFDDYYNTAVFLVGSFGINETNAGKQDSAFSVNGLHLTLYLQRAVGREISAIPTGYSYIGEFETRYGVSSVGNYIYDLYASSPDMFWNTGLIFGNTAPISDTSFEENYPVWAESAILYPPVTLPGGTEDDEAIPYVPVSVPVYSSAAPSLPLTQTEVWTGKDLTSSGTDTDDEEQVIPITPDLSQPVNSILELIVQIAADILAIKNAVVTWFTETWSAFTSWLMETLTAIKEAVIALPGLIVAAIEAVAATVTSIWEWLKEVLGLTLQQILEALTAIKAWALGLVDALIAALAALLTEIFGVDIAAVQAAVAELRAEFPFFDSIIATGEFLYNGISSGEPPVIYAHLQNAEGSYSWGGTVAVLDMSFYARYKSTGDAIISAALYAFFGWRTFVRLPGIISGAGSDIKEVTNHYDI